MSAWPALQRVDPGLLVGEVADRDPGRGGADRLPVVGVLGHDHRSLGTPLPERERAGARPGAAAKSAPGFVSRRRRHHHPGAVGEDLHREVSGRFEVDRHLGRSGRLDRVDHREVGLDLRVSRQGALEAGLDRLAVERRPVLEGDALAQGQHQRLRVGRRSTPSPDPAAAPASWGRSSPAGRRSGRATSGRHRWIRRPGRARTAPVDPRPSALRPPSAAPTSRPASRRSPRTRPPPNRPRAQALQP